MYIYYDKLEMTLKKFLLQKETTVLHNYWNIVKEFMRQTCSAVKYLHDRQLMHTGIQAENIFIEDGKTLKLCDFEHPIIGCYGPSTTDMRKQNFKDIILMFYQIAL